MASNMSRHKSKAAVRTLSKLKLNTRTIVGTAVIVAGAGIAAAAAAFLTISRQCVFPDGRVGGACLTDLQCPSKGRCVIVNNATRATRPLSSPIVIPKITPPPAKPAPPYPIKVPIPPRPGTKVK